MMDASEFDNIKRAVGERHFKDEKLDAIRSTLGCSSGYLSADQVAQLVKEFPFDDERVKCVEICAPRMYATTCEEAANILRVFSFDKSKTQALQIVAQQITDNNLAALDSAFSFQSDRQRAREILMNRTRSGLQPGLPRQPGAYPAGLPPGGFPGMTPQPGGFPAPVPYPGSTPYPGQSPYPAPGPYGPPPGAYPYAALGTAQYPTGTAPPPGVPQYPPQGGYYLPSAGYPQQAPGGYPQTGYPYHPPQ